MEERFVAATLAWLAVGPWQAPLPCHAASEVPVQRTKVLLIGEADAPTIVRLRDELRLLGYRVDVLETREPEEPATFARSRGASAVAVVQGAPAAVEIWVEPAAMTSLSVSSSLTVVSPGSEARPELLALRAVEALRGRLLPLPPAAQTQRNPPSGTPTAPPAPGLSPLPTDGSPSTLAGPSDGLEAPRPTAAPAATASTVTSFAPPEPRPAPRAGLTAPADAAAGTAQLDDRPSALALSPTVTLTPGGVPAMFQLRLSGRYRVWERLGLEARALLPTAAASLSAPEGDIDARLIAFGIGAAVEMLEPSSDWSLSALAGMSATCVLYDAEARGEVAASSGGSWAGAPSLALSAAYRLVPVLALRADAEAALFVPKQIFRVGTREVASFGEPLVALSFGLEVRP